MGFAVLLPGTTGVAFAVGGRYGSVSGAEGGGGFGPFRYADVDDCPPPECHPPEGGLGGGAFTLATHTPGDGIFEPLVQDVLG